MIEITFDPEKLDLRITGHAGAGEAGHDLVCCAVSTLFYTLAECLTDCSEMLEEEMIYEYEEGNGHIQCTPKARYLAIIQRTYYTVLTGLHMLAKAYPQYLLLIN